MTKNYICDDCGEKYTLYDEQERDLCDCGNVLREASFAEAVGE